MSRFKIHQVRRPWWSLLPPELEVRDTLTGVCYHPRMDFSATVRTKAMSNWANGEMLVTQSSTSEPKRQTT